MNQIRLDRVRGVCCEEGRDGRLEVIVEPLGSKLETEVVLVHELVHALHRQHGLLDVDPATLDAAERPFPWASVVEGTAQFIALRWFAEQPIEEQDVVGPELLIIDDELAELTGKIAARLLNYAYFAALQLPEAVYAERGPAGLSDLFSDPPTTLEQVEYPERWIVRQEPTEIDEPQIPDQSVLVERGRLGVGVLRWLIADTIGDEAARELLAEWAGDRYTIYDQAGGFCLVGIVEMDTAPTAELVAAALATDRGFAVDAVGPTQLAFDTCG